MFIDLERSPLSDFEKGLCREPFESFVTFLNVMTGVRETYPSDDILRKWVNSVVLSAFDGHLVGEPINVSLLVTGDYDPGQFERIIVALAGHGYLSYDRRARRNGDGLDSLQYELSEEFLEPHPNLKAEILNHSRPFDVHKSSNHPEVNGFVDSIYKEHFTGGNVNVNVRKKHIKTLLLDLYVAWKDDPALKITVERSPNAYEGRTRYNEIHISRTTIPVVDTLIEAGLILQAIGRYDRESRRGNTTRIWPTPKLLKLFEEARWGPMDITSHPDRECIVLRDEDGNDIEYEDTDETKQMREKLTRYNDLIDRTFIDIPTLEVPFIEIGGRTASRVYVNQSNKFTRRIFNRSSFAHGGRF